MSEMSEGQAFMLACLDVTKQVQAVCQKLEGIVEESIIAGELPRVGTKESPAKVYTTAGILLMLCGIVADDESEHKAMLEVASLLGKSKMVSPVESDRIRRSMDDLLDALGMVRTRHLWN